MKKTLSALVLTVAMGWSAMATVTITPATGGLNISGSLASDGTAPGWVTLGNINVAEQTPGVGHQKDFSKVPGGIWSLKAPAGFEFNTGATPGVSYTSDITAMA